jgi:hypothetical protein
MACLQWKAVKMIPLFVGQDRREQIGLSVFTHSVWSRTSQPVSITPISGPTDGTNAFTLARFQIPKLMSYIGWAIWADGSDMLCLADIAELWAMRDPYKAVQVVKHDYKTRHPVKYLGQRNEDYIRKNWSSLMLINCAHYGWRHIDGYTPQRLHRLDFFADSEIGELPKEWNYLCDEDNQQGPAKIAHHSIGLPVWYPETEYSAEWHAELAASLHYQPWERESEGACIA